MNDESVLKSIGGLIPMPSKGAKLLFWAEKLEKKYFHDREIPIFCLGEWFGTFCVQWDQSQNTVWD